MAWISRHIETLEGGEVELHTEGIGFEDNSPEDGRRMSWWYGHWRDSLNHVLARGLREGRVLYERHA